MGPQRKPIVHFINRFDVEKGYSGGTVALAATAFDAEINFEFGFIFYFHNDTAYESERIHSSHAHTHNATYNNETKNEFRLS